MEKVDPVLSNIIITTTTPVAIYIEVNIDEPPAGENYGVGDDIDVEYKIDGAGDGVEYYHSVSDKDGLNY